MFRIIDAGIKSGMNRVDGVSFDARNEDKMNIKENLIQLAIQDA